MTSVAIIGLGYVGLPLAIRFAQVKINTVGFDIDLAKIDELALGNSYIKHISSDSVKQALANGFSATSDFSKIANATHIIICVPTPLNKYREPDLSYVINTLNAISPYIKKGQLISLESTTYPGTTEEELVNRFEKAGFEIGKDLYIVFSPEREDPGNPKYCTSNTPKVIGGHTQKCLEKGIELYSQVIDKLVPVSSTKVAEMAKLLENIHRAVNIGLINEMKMISDKMGINIYEVIDAAATKPFGFTPYYPGPGLGGHCIPIDPFYLTWKAKEYGMHTRFIELAGEINRDMPYWVIHKTSMALNSHKKAINGSKILVIGLAYKKNIDDSRESPSAEIIEELTHMGAVISYHDSFIPKFPKMREYNFDMQSVELTNDNIKQFDCVLLITDHDYIDYNHLLENSSILIDTRGRYRNVKSDRVFAA